MPHLIGINNDCTQLSQKLGNSALAATYAAGKTYNLHFIQVYPVLARQSREFLLYNPIPLYPLPLDKGKGNFLIKRGFTSLQLSPKG
jgi:hypothetical protein